MPQGAELYADGAHNSEAFRFTCRRYGLRDRIPKPNDKGASHLGRVRWVVERTLAWLKQCRRLLIRFKRSADLFLALLQPACAMIVLCCRR